MTLKVEVILAKDTKFVLPVNTRLRAMDLSAGSNIIDIFLLGDGFIYHIQLVEKISYICLLHGELQSSIECQHFASHAYVPSLW